MRSGNFGRAIGLLVAFLIADAAGAWAGEYRLLEIDGLKLKWEAPVFGTGAEVTWGLAERRESFPDAVNCRAMAPAADMAVRNGGAGRFEAAAAEAFAMWSRAVDIDFRRAGPGERPDILIGAQAEPFRVAFANVWHDAGAVREGVAPLTRATICMNPRVPWIVDGPAPVGAHHLTTVLAHEIGHAIGLDHPGATGALMGYQNQGAMVALLPGDIEGGRRLYGAP